MHNNKDTLSTLNGIKEVTMFSTGQPDICLLEDITPITKKQLHVLVAEDQAIQFVVLRRALEPFFPQINYDHVLNGQEAVDRILSNKYYDFIILDNTMPVLCGVDAAVQIRAYEKNRNLKNRFTLLSYSSDFVNGNKFTAQDGTVLTDLALPKPISIRFLINNYEFLTFMGDRFSHDECESNSSALISRCSL